MEDAPPSRLFPPTANQRAQLIKHLSSIFRLTHRQSLNQDGLGSCISPDSVSSCFVISCEETKVYLALVAPSPQTRPGSRITDKSGENDRCESGRAEC